MEDQLIMKDEDATILMSKCNDESSRNGTGGVESSQRKKKKKIERGRKWGRVTRVNNASK